MSSKPTSPPAAPDISITGDQIQLYPSGYTQSSSPNSHHDTHDRNLVEHMARFRESPLDFLRELSLHVQGSGWRSYDRIVGQPVFYSGFSDRMKASVLASPMLQTKIAELVSKRLAVEEKEGFVRSQGSDNDTRKARRRTDLEESLREVADRMTDEMICKMESKRFIRGAYYLVTALLTRAYHQGRLLFNIPGTPAKICCKAFTSQVKRSFVYARLLKRPPRKANRSFSFHAIGPTSTISHCS